MNNKALFLFLSLFFIVCQISAQQTKTAKLANTESDYDIQDSVSIKTRDGAILSAMVARKKNDETPKPVILQYTIYVRDTGRDLKSIKESVDKGYIGVIVYARGKRFSPNEINPYEDEANDVYDAIDWISKQNWCSRSIGMYGGSYNGFTQWVACKKLHPALKTIVPAVANRPGMGLPMENNIFINPNYEWAFYVGNNKYLDTVTNNNRPRFRGLKFRWWEAGTAYKTLDSIDGEPNRWFQKWIKHPSFDAYWQKMAPYKNDFSQINIPVLAFDGYYNDSQNSSLYYLKELQKYSPKTPFYLIIGPYGHFGTQIGGEAVINDYKVDANALFDIKKITYQWFDYILKNGTKPDVLKDKINYEVMGANEWKSAPSFEKMHNDFLTFYLTNNKTGDFYLADSKKPKKKEFLSQEVDFKDRQNSNNNYYPSPIIKKEVNTNDGYFYMSEPLKEPLIVNGSFLGEIKCSINKKDMDLGVTLYEVTPEGEYFHLSYYIGRASYAKDIEKRQLLEPNTIETISFTNTHFASKQLRKGSRLLIAVTINKNPFSQLNYGTGKDVSDETILDAKEPLQIKWYNDSFVKIPVLK
ncbi:CocE/NonD family hydrolase [Flavobacterium defluvii]|uniref:Xaa-Pro dipeptidyl-peptidase C-terminal domain-containing protein n=1 Tax=Flavobacterium defluvii TaxID=370979 RepID=A0A1M5PMV0_9FLAO|nr:CocE/NonD family hydrolase [Flavobacterium defluvii]SHH03064.1 hypothetical protein SAMN05443663_10565 [Flavobacterium defluvii]